MRSIFSIRWFVFLTSVVVLTACNEEAKTAPAKPEAEKVAQTSNEVVLSEKAQEGQKLFALCDACHNVSLDPPKAPPMYGVQRRYKMTYGDREGFVKAVTDFVQHPAMDKVVMRRPAMKMGLMPAMPLPADQLEKIANFIYEYPFPPPCNHWRIAVKNAEVAGEVDDHIEHDKMKLQKMCQ